LREKREKEKRRSQKNNTEKELIDKGTSKSRTWTKKQKQTFKNV
jgi:hypothetical protein